jgi:uncharacterized membrane protein
MTALLFAFLIGVFTGLRSLTAPAATAWASHFGWLRLEPPLAVLGSGISVAVFTTLAIGELLVDKLPQTPSRTAPLGLGARIVAGAVTGACVASGGGQVALLGALLGATGGVVGAFAGYQARTRLVKALGIRDVVVAIVEDVVALAGSLLIVSHV